MKDLITYIKTIPEKPGIYKYFSKDGKIIYVGKAKNLKKRIYSYFQKTFENNKTAVLVKQITKIEYLVVDTELDALLLENNLIKQYRPKYNILLKDDKTFPWIGIKNEAFARVISTRKKENDGTRYFGPYANVKMMNTLLKLIKETYPLRSCNFDLRQKNIQENKFKVCLDYHIGKCKGPCVGYQSEESYLESIHQITLLLKGKTNALLQELKLKMQESSKELAFEKAQEYKEIYEQLLQYRSKSMVVSNHVLDLDVISLIEDERSFFINYLVVSEGAIIHGYSSEIIKKLEESASDVLSFTLPELRERYQSQNKEVLTSHPLNIDFKYFECHVPQKGDKFKLLELSVKNANYFRLDQRKKESLVAPERHTQRILEQIKKDFHLTDLPHHIECFDNSNFQGTNAVAACVVFKDAKPYKKEYRHFLIKTVDGPDDFASMKEIVFRRYKRLKEEKLPFPQLVVIDGGKGQLSAAMESIDALGLRGSFAVVGIAKKLEEIFFPGDSYPLYIDKKSESLKVIQHIRNEAHRFGITHHRDLRSKNAIQSSLLDIPGIGLKTMTHLFQEFKTIKAINSAELMALEKCIGTAKALIVRKALNAST